MDHQAIVIGGGHNGLVCAAYLARAGIDTLVVEARDSVGGCASTVDAVGARVNICNCDHITFRSTPIADELALADHGLRYLGVDPAQWQQAYDGGPAWPVFTDVDRTLDALARTHPHEVDGYRAYARQAVPAARLVLDLANEAPTPGSVLRRLAGLRGIGAATVARWSRASAAEVLQSFFRTDALLGPAFASGPAVWGLPPSWPGTGLGALALALKHVAGVGRPAGGSGALPVALLGAFEAAGGEVRTSARVTTIECEGERVRGVRLADGTVLEAPTVVVACDPRLAFVEWLRRPPAAAEGLVARWRDAPVHEGYESKIDAVVAAAPRYRAVDPALADTLGVDPTEATMVVAPGLGAFERAHVLLGQGRVAERPMLLVNLPSVRDPALVPPAGGHVFSLEVLYTPYSLEGGWASGGEPRRWLEVLASLVEPGFLDGLGAWRTMTPEAYEGEFFLPRGHATSFAGGPVAALTGRQRELTRYETPVEGLFLTGAATFPGAGVWGAPGRNAARVVLRSLDRPLGR
jgi:phytoene dehydrogenase-like protein